MKCEDAVLQRVMILITVIGLMMSLLAGPLFSQGLTVIGEIHDGTPQDVAAGDGVIYLAQGRYLSLLDPQTGLRTGNHNDYKYPTAVVAVEYDLASNTLITATERALYIFENGEDPILWHNETGKSIVDIKCIPADKKVIAVVSDKVYIIDYSSDATEVVSHLSVPEGIMFFVRLHIAHTGQGWMAYLTGAITGQQARGINGLIIAYLDSANNYAEPFAYSGFWNPVDHYGSAAATARNVQVIDRYDEDFTFAFVACGVLGQLTVLDVTDPQEVKFVRKIELSEGFPVTNVITSDDGDRLFAASMNILHGIDLATLRVTGSLNAGFFDAGNRDMALYRDGDVKQVWTATNASVDYVINAVDVTTSRFNHAVRQWWISSSDGAVAIPEWNSLYLPTFGGIVRYDISDPTNPKAVDESYQPAGGTIEHIDLLFPQEGNLRQALLLTAPGNGGVQIWEISAAEPNPARPVKVVQRPAQWGNDPVYQNDVGWFRKDGVIYYLADLANRSNQEVALQIYNMETEEWLDVIVDHPDLRSNCKSITVSHKYEYALVSCFGGFFVVDLSGLPHSTAVTDIVVNDWNNNGRPDDVNALVLSTDSDFIFIAHDPGVVQSFEFDKQAGTVSGPIDQLYGEEIYGCTNRGRYFGRLNRLYIAARGGNILEIDAADPYNLTLLSRWNNGGYFGEMQDCHIYNIGGKDVVLAVKNNAGFALLEIQESSSIDQKEDTVNIFNRPVILEQNYPNPFNPETTVRFTVNEPGEIRLAVYNLKGQLIRTLKEARLEQGEYFVVWDGEDSKQNPVSGGVYLLKLCTDNFTALKKALLLK